jgi:hypothetical protein
MTAGYTPGPTATTTLPVDPVTAAAAPFDRAVVIDWLESEAGWGIRPDGWTIHRDTAAADRYLTAMRDREAATHGGKTPPEYIRPDGKPRDVTVTPDVARAIIARESEGQDKALWGHGRYGPAEGTVVDVAVLRGTG